MGAISGKGDKSKVLSEAKVVVITRRPFFDRIYDLGDDSPEIRNLIEDWRREWAEAIAQHIDQEIIELDSNMSPQQIKQALLEAGENNTKKNKE